MIICKYVQKLDVVRQTDITDNVAEKNIPSAKEEFLRHDTVEVGDGKYVPFHAIDHVKNSVNVMMTDITDDTCNGGDTPPGPEPDTYMTVLYEDGTFIINEGSKNREANIAKHGAVVSEYDPWSEESPYKYESAGGVPWKERFKKIKAIEFGSTVAPESIAFWFSKCENLTSIDWANFDGSDVTTAQAFVNETGITELVLPAMPNLTSIRYIARGCDSLTKADFSNVRTTKLESTVDAFQGCTALVEVNLTGLGGDVKECTRTFSNIIGGGDMVIKTIYADDSLNFQNATDSSSMFRGCLQLVGGQGTVYDSSRTNNAYARIDGGSSDPGYFTAK